MPNLTLNISADSVAWYGAIVATISMILVSYNVWRDRAKVIVRHQKGMKIINAIPPYSEDKDYLVVTITNKGRRPIRLGVVGLFCESGESLLLSNSLLDDPKNILNEENPEATVMAEQKDIDFLKVLYIQVFDKAGRSYKQYLSQFPTFRRFWYKIKNYLMNKKDNK